VTAGAFSWTFDNAGNFSKTFTTNTGNIGTQTNYFNTVFAKATSAQYADLAEKFEADAEYQPGTVLDFGGSKEVTLSTASHSSRVAGVVSTNPSYLMNSMQQGENVVELALTGRVPTMVVGPVGKGDRLVTSHIPGVAQRLDPALYQPGTIIGKSLEEYHGNVPAMITVVVGRT
jgi:hypothetical protein